MNQAINQGLVADVADPFPTSDVSGDAAVEIDVDGTLQATFGSTSGHDPLLSSTLLLGLEVGAVENAAPLHPTSADPSSVCLPVPTNLRSSLEINAPMAAPEEVNDGSALPHSSASPDDDGATSTLQPDDMTR